ncbi:MAG: EAL domain-containing protein [Deltaproteobacteria bacterium]|nr:EAL domain-containing protein [Deltaproteobacteria bacterium]
MRGKGDSHPRIPSTVSRRLGDTSLIAGPSSSTLDVPARVIDLVTGFPSLTSLHNELRPLAEDAAGATILYVHLPSTQIIEERFGWETLGAYAGLLANYLGRVARDLERERGHCAVLRSFADDYVLLIPQRENDAEIPSRLGEGMLRHLQAMDEELATIHQVYVGISRVTPYAKIHPERQLFRGIQRAQTEATDVGRQKLAVQTRVLDRAIANRSFNMVYQPIVNIHDHSIFAYEALVRCTQPELRNPHVLFSVAEQAGRIWPLSRLLRKMAVDSVTSMPDGSLLFVNLHPLDFNDPELLRPEPFIVEHAANLVLEVTERATITDFEHFRRNMDVLRSSGVRIAVDDLGSGYAALSSVAELNPDFIKFDMTLIRGIDQSPIRRNLLRNMVAFAVEAGTQVIAEGVETRAELDTLRELGCHFVQGFFLAMPLPPFTLEIAPRQPSPEELPAESS